MVLGWRGAGLVMVVPWGGTQTPRVFKNPWGLAGLLGFDDGYFFGGEAVELVDDLVDEVVGGGEAAG